MICDGADKLWERNGSFSRNELKFKFFAPFTGRFDDERAALQQPEHPVIPRDFCCWYSGQAPAMEIYQDVDDGSSDVVKAAHIANPAAAFGSPPGRRKTVSFAGTTKTPRSATTMTPGKSKSTSSSTIGSVTWTPTRTPLRNLGRNHQSPCVSPKPASHQQVQTESSLRNESDPWFTPTLTSSGRKIIPGSQTNTLAGTKSEEEKPSNQLSLDAKAKRTPHQGVSNVTVEQHQQQQQQLRPATTPNSASNFRRSLRATLPPPSGATRNVPLKSESTLTTAVSNLNKHQPQQPLEKPAAQRFFSLSKSTTASSLAAVGVRSRLGAHNLKRLGSTDWAVGGGVLGPPRRVVPQTPNSLLRTELEAFDSASSSESEGGRGGNESLLLTPPPGALWDRFPGSGESTHTAAYNDLATGLVVVSPQAAAQLNKQWSSSKPKQQHHKEKAEDKKRQPQLAEAQTSPTLPRAILQTPRPTLALEVKNNNIRSAEKNTEIVHKSTKGGVAIDLSGMFSPETMVSRRKDSKCVVDKQSLQKEKKATSLASAMPAAVLSKLSTNKRVSRLPSAVVDKKKDLTVRQTARSEKSTASSTSSSFSLAMTRRMRQPAQAENEVSTTRSKTVPPKKSTSTPISRTDEDNTPSTYRSTKVNQNDTSRERMNKPWRTQAKIEAQIAQMDSSALTCTENRRGVAFDVTFELAQTKSTDNAPSTMKGSRIATPPKIHSSEDWAEAQSSSFVGWLNYTFHPEEEEGRMEGELASSGNICSNIAGLRTLLLHRRLAQGRSKAMSMFRCNGMRSIRQAILTDIAGGRLSIRADRDVTADIQLRRQLATLLLSYTTPWLRLGLEVMFGECIEPVPFNEEVPKTYLVRMKQGLELFIKRRVLSDDNTLSKFTKGRCTLPSGVFEKRYKAQMRSLVLSRIMVLIFFLDRAKMENVLDKVPRLFTVSSEVKSSRDVIVAVCRACLSAEGDIIKHLSRIGLTVSYQQKPVDEVNFRVTNLATELRDGVLLTRLAEIVMGAPFKSLMSSLRLPALSRLQKKFNVTHAMAKLQELGIAIPHGVNAYHIMDGHREAVLALMWCIISHCCMTRLLKGKVVEQEIEKVLRSSHARQMIRGPMLRYHNPVSVDSVKSPSLETKATLPEDVLSHLLLRWSHAVCFSFGVYVEDFTTSFANGKAICLLVHYYHPSLIRLKDVLHAEDGAEAEVLHVNEQKNWKNAARAVREMGGIPNMLPVCDSIHPPNEKTMVLCLSYLCSRLMESSNEIFATILIQSCYRKFKEKVLLEKKMAATRKIFDFWTEHKENYYRARQKRYAAAVAMLEEFVFVHKHALRRLKQERLKRELWQRSATIIQKVFRGVLGRDHACQIWEEREAALAIQSHFRGCMARQFVFCLNQTHHAATKIQRVYRGSIEQREFSAIKFFANELQRVLRGHLVRVDLQRRKRAILVLQHSWWEYVAYKATKFAATVLQKTWRGVLGRRINAHTLLERGAACAIQKIWRGYYQSLVFFFSIESIILLQKVTRGFISRKELPFRRYQRAAILIQKVWRGFSVQVQFQVDMMDVVCVQSHVRRFLGQQSHDCRIRAISTLQGAIRCALARRQLNQRVEAKILALKRHDAAITTQCAVRCWIARSRLSFRETLHCAALAIQKNWRGYSRRTSYETILRAARLIQAQTRRLVVKHQIIVLNRAACVVQRKWRQFEWYRLEEDAAVEIQSAWRSRAARVTFQRCKQSSISIQKYWRGGVTRQDLHGMQFAATLLQATWRRYWAESNFQLDLLELVIAQSAVRRYLARRKCARRRLTVLENHSAASIIQSQWRGFVAYVKYSTLVADATVVQKMARRYLAKRKAQKILSCVAKIQAVAQIFLATRSIRREMLLKNLSASRVQSVVRGYLMRISYGKDCKDIVTCQSLVRRWLTSRDVEAKHQASIVIQSMSRRHIAIEVVCIARAKRSFEQRQHLSAIAIQAGVRGHKARVFYRREVAAKRIQTMWRCYVTHIDFLFKVLMIISIQARSRSFLAKKNFQRSMKAIVMSQAVSRGFLVRKQIERQHDAATAIQSAFRMYIDKTDFMIVGMAASIIQRYARGVLCRVELDARHYAARDIQRIWRGYYFSAEYIVSFFSILRIQSFVRMSLTRRRYLILTLKRTRMATLIQRAFRQYVHRAQMKAAACVIQQAFRSYSEWRRIQLVSYGVLRFQSIVRGRQVRRRRNKKLVQVSRRLREETKKAIQYPSLRLGARTHRALEIIRHSESLTKIMEAVKELEASTRLSFVCCQVFTDAGAADDLLRLIQSCNRSVPHMELKGHILLTLENIGQYQDLVLSLATSTYCEVFMDNIQVFRDKDDIFCLAVSLLDRITHADLALSQFCSTHEHLKRLKEVYRVVSRRKLHQHESRRLQSKKTMIQYGLKKRDVFDRSASTKLLGELILDFSEPEHLPAGQLRQDQHFTFD